MIKRKISNQIFMIFVFLYIICYTTAAEERNIHQNEISSNVCLSEVALESKKVYLTFDDGPSYKITNKLLDNLKENEVKATFFVVGKEIVGRENILRRIHEEGHSIALHTYSHDFKKIYRSNDIFIDEMKRTSELIKGIVGIEPKAIRFPGGSAGVLNEEFLNKIHQNGFKIYDWNVDLLDGVNPDLSVERLLNNAKRAKGEQNNRIILAHCNYNNVNTCRVLADIIKYYKEQGFSFETIDDNTEEYYYKLRR